MEKGRFRMGVSHLNKSKSNFSKKTSFFHSLSFFGKSQNKLNKSVSIHFFGKRAGSSIIKAEHHIEQLKIVLKFARELSKKPGILLFVNTQGVFNGIIKIFSLRCCETFCLNKWTAGSLTKNTATMPYRGFILYNPKKKYWSHKRDKQNRLAYNSFS